MSNLADAFYLQSFGFKIIKLNDIRKIKRHRQKRLNKKLNKKYGIKTKGIFPNDKIMFDKINMNIYVPSSQYDNFMQAINNEILRK